MEFNVTNATNTTIKFLNDTLIYLNKQTTSTPEEEKSFGQKTLDFVLLLGGAAIGIGALIGCCYFCNKRGSDGKRPIDLVKEMGEVVNTTKFEHGTWTPGIVSQETKNSYLKYTRFDA
ncbi:MAG: hypothetical protein RI930_375 [Pseudomonadota bacterium]|jgi:hypothetical protein